MESGVVTKHELFMWQAPSFNFELNADEILAKALEVGFVIEASDDQYLVNVDYNSERQSYIRENIDT